MALPQLCPAAPHVRARRKRTARAIACPPRRPLGTSRETGGGGARKFWRRPFLTLKSRLKAARRRGGKKKDRSKGTSFRDHQHANASTLRGMEVGCVDADTIMDDEGELRQEVGGHTVATRAEVEEGGERLSLKTRRSPKPYARPKNSKLLNPNPPKS